MARLWCDEVGWRARVETGEILVPRSGTEADCKTLVRAWLGGRADDP